MQVIMNECFDNETIVFDGFSFKNCRFTNCLILITSMDFHFEGCSFARSTLHVHSELPIFEVSHRLSQSDYDDETYCFRNDGKYPQTRLPLRSQEDEVAVAGAESKRQEGHDREAIVAD